jgi:hypothetical protein
MERSCVGALAFCGLLLLASAAATAPGNLAHLDLYVVDEDGLPVPNFPFLIETSEGEVFVLVTDEEGWAHADFKIKGNKTLDVSVTPPGGTTADISLWRGASASETLILGPCERGYEWAIID